MQAPKDQVLPILVCQHHVNKLVNCHMLVSDPAISTAHGQLAVCRASSHLEMK